VLIGVRDEQDAVAAAAAKAASHGGGNGASDGGCGSKKPMGETAAIGGDALCLLSAFLYATYTVVLKQATTAKPNTASSSTTKVTTTTATTTTAMSTATTAATSAATTSKKGAVATVGVGLDDDFGTRISDGDETDDIGVDVVSNDFRNGVHVDVRDDDLIRSDDDGCCGGGGGGSSVGAPRARDNLGAGHFDNMNSGSDGDGGSDDEDGVEREVDMLFLFGAVGLLNLLLFWPLFPLLHRTGFETFEVPPLRVLGFLFANGLLGSVVSGK
jgi:hypothetical protein